MKGIKTFLVFIACLIIGMIFSVVMLFFTYSTPDNPMKFTVWRPKPMNYKSELIEKWSVPYNQEPKYSPAVYVRKNGWILSNRSRSNCIELTKDGQVNSSFRIGYGLDDENSDRSIESDFSNLTYYNNDYSTKYSLEWCEYFITDKDYIYYSNNLDNVVNKVDLNNGELIWSYHLESDFPHIKPPMYIVRDKLVLNTYVWGKDKEGNPETPNTVTLVDVTSGKSQVLDIPGSIIGTVFNDELYLIIDDVRVSRYNVTEMNLVGEMFDIRDKYKNGSYFYNISHYWFTFTTNGEHADLLLNPSTMDLCNLNAEMCKSSNFLYDDYWLCWIRRNGTMIGIDTKTFEETWVIPADKLSKEATVLMGDYRGILVQDGDKIICFNRP